MHTWRCCSSLVADTAKLACVPVLLHSFFLPPPPPPSFRRRLTRQRRGEQFPVPTSDALGELDSTLGPQTSMTLDTFDGGLGPQPSVGGYRGGRDEPVSGSEEFDSFEASAGGAGIDLGLSPPPTVMAGGIALAPTARPSSHVSSRQQEPVPARCVRVCCCCCVLLDPWRTCLRMCEDEGSTSLCSSLRAVEWGRKETVGNVRNIGDLDAMIADVPVEEEEVSSEALQIARQAASRKSAADITRETFPVGTKIEAAYAGGDDWFPGKVSAKLCANKPAPRICVLTHCVGGLSSGVTYPS